jgi:hypothetical protein
MLKELGVGWLDRTLLRLAARRSELPQPTVMLFTPELWQKYAGGWAKSIGIPPIRSYVLNRVRAVTQKAFPET